ncbi:MAG: hypothetical protein H7210_03480 [Pyrinomonadaceae bacterium]|nr:hypothetical protein [Phycisphaerales bacterium]
MTHPQTHRYLRAIAAISASLLASLPLAHAQTPADACLAAPLVAVPGSYTGSTSAATNDGSATCGQSSTTRDVWLKVSPAANLALVASTCGGAAFDTVLSVHTACPGAAGSQIACLDDSCGQQSQLSVNVSAGATYFVRIAGFDGASGPFTISLSYTPQPPAPNAGPDIIVGEITDIARWGAVGGITAYNVGTTSCNIGTVDAQWVVNTNQHPLIGQQMYRLKSGRFEQIGQSWLKHTFGTIDNGICGPCNGHLGQVLGVGCSDPYSAGQAGDIALLGPKWQVNATTGAYPYPFFNNPPPQGTIGRRIQVATSDVDPAQNAGAQYIFEAVYIANDDSLAGNGRNNYSHLPVTIASATSTPVAGGPTRRLRPAITAWKTVDSSVTEVNADYTESGLPARFIVSAKATSNADNTWNYEYAVFNLNANRSGRGFTVPVSPGVVVTSTGFHDVAYHSGDGINGVSFDGTDWSPSFAPGLVTWTTQTFAQNPSANALRWGTLYNFRFTASAPPRSGDASIELFKPGAGGEPASILAVGLPVPGCPADWFENGVVNSQDFFEFVADFFSENADFNRDGLTTSQDLFDFLVSFFAGC